MESLQMDSLKSIVTLTVNTNLIMVKYLMVPHLLKMLKLRLMVKHVVPRNAPRHGIVFQVSFAKARHGGRATYVGHRREEVCWVCRDPSVMHALLQQMPLDLVEEMLAWSPVHCPTTVVLKCSVVLITAFAWTDQQVEDGVRTAMLTLLLLLLLLLVTAEVKILFLITTLLQ
jgi:hypothetical protein